MSKFWLPKLSVKQFQIFNDYHYALLVSGPRKSGKTLGVTHKIVRHAWDTNKARVGVFTKTTKLAKDGGCWTDLIGSINEWVDADVGLQWKTESKQAGDTRQTYCEITNRHGTVSTIVLNSLDYDDDIEAAVKGKSYTCCWFNELSNFRKRKVFDISSQQLRGKGIPFSTFQWIGDTNPADEGEESWIYELFYNERTQEKHPNPKFQKNLGLLEIMIPDNPFLPEEEVEQLKSTYHHDQNLYERYILGKWTTATTESHFSDVFKPETHVIGDMTSPDPNEWEVLLPEENCHEMIIGWDLGAINHAVSFVEQAYIGGKLVFKVLDEVVILGEQISISNIVNLVMEKIDYWEAQVGKTLHWRSFSDKDALTVFRPAVENYDANLIYAASGGRLALQAAIKFSGSVAHRINLARRLLFEDRLLISVTCTNHIQMFKGLRKGKTLANFIDRGSRFKHCADALTYGICGVIPEEMYQIATPKSGEAKAKLITI